jgi:beta-glucosidase
MLGFNSAATNALTDKSATALKAMRQACKNILYTVGNSGYYADGAAGGGMDNMTKTFLFADLGIAAALILLEVILLTRYNKKRKAAEA